MKKVHPTLWNRRKYRYILDIVWNILNTTDVLDSKLSKFRRSSLRV